MVVQAIPPERYIPLSEDTNFKGLFALASVATAVLAVGAGWHFTKNAIVGSIVEQQEKDTAEIHLHLSCWASAGLEPPETQLSEYIYCKYGMVSKRKAAP